jgi:hypothetical protein
MDTNQHEPERPQENTARQSRNHKSADSFVRVFLPQRKQLANKAVRAPGESFQNATKLGALHGTQNEFLPRRLDG